MSVMLVAQQLQAQNFKETLLRAKEIFSAPQRMELSMTIRAVDKNDADRVLFTEKAMAQKDSAKYHSQFNGVEVLMNSRYLILVNHTLKQIQYTRNTTATQAPTNQLLNVNIDSLLNVYGKATYVGKRNEFDQFEIKHGKGPINTTEMYFAASGMLKKIIYHYASGQQVEITVDDFNTNPTWSSDLFLESKYWDNLGGTFKTTPAFAGYKLMASGLGAGKSKKTN